MVPLMTKGKNIGKTKGGSKDKVTEGRRRPVVDEVHQVVESVRVLTPTVTPGRTVDEGGSTLILSF